MPKERDYEALASTRLRKRPTLVDCLDILKKDYPLKLPDRRWIHLWDSPDMSVFRGVQEDLDDEAERKQAHIAERIHVVHQAREAAASVEPDLTSVQQMAQSQRQMGEAFAKHAADLGAAHMQQVAGMRHEQEAMLHRMTGQIDAANKRS